VEVTIGRDDVAEVPRTSSFPFVRMMGQSWSA